MSTTPGPKSEATMLFRGQVFTEPAATDHAARFSQGLTWDCVSRPPLYTALAGSGSLWQRRSTTLVGTSSYPMPQRNRSIALTQVIQWEDAKATRVEDYLAAEEP